MTPAAQFIDTALSYKLESAEWLPSLDYIDVLVRDRPELGAERHMLAGGWMLYAGPQSPLNHIVGMGLRGPFRTKSSTAWRTSIAAMIPSARS
jgi:hypothetical protein